MSTGIINSRIKKSKLFTKLADKKYRHLFVTSQINKLIPYQMRGLRARRDLTQAALAELAETTQTVISRIENNGATNLSVKTLLKLAEAFDVALVVRFEPIDRFITWVDEFSPEDISFESSESILDEATKEQASIKNTSESAGTAIPSLRLVKAQPTGAQAKAQTVGAYKQQSLLDRPQGVVGTASDLTIQSEPSTATKATDPTIYFDSNSTAVRDAA